MSPKPSLDDLRIERSAPPSPKPRTWPILIGVGTVLIVGGVLWFFRQPKPFEVHTVAAREISSGSAGAGDRTVLNASGYVTARRQATVSSKITGKVTEVLIEEGVKVKEGQVLARLDDTNIKASLHLAEAQLESANAAIAETQARLKEADINLRR